MMRVGVRRTGIPAKDGESNAAGMEPKINHSAKSRRTVPCFR